MSDAMSLTTLHAVCAFLKKGGGTDYMLGSSSSAVTGATTITLTVPTATALLVRLHEHDPPPALTLVRPTAAELRALQEEAVLAPSGALDRILAEVRAQAKAGYPYAQVDLRKVDFIPGYVTTSLCQVVVNALNDLDYSGIAVGSSKDAVNPMHSWECFKQHPAVPCSTPHICGYGIMTVLWNAKK